MAINPGASKLGRSLREWERKMRSAQTVQDVRDIIDDPAFTRLDGAAGLDDICTRPRAFVRIAGGPSSTLDFPNHFLTDKGRDRVREAIGDEPVKATIKGDPPAEENEASVA